MKQAEQLLSQALDAFDFGAPVAHAERFGCGHINDTFCVQTEPPAGRRFVLQRINTSVFRDPARLMENVVSVTRYLRERIAECGGDPARETLNVVFTRDGKPYYTDETGGAWRVYDFIEHAVCLQAAESPALFAAAGRAFGRFARLLSDYPIETLHETIPRFHDTPNRLAQLKAAADADVCGRVKDVRAELDFILHRAADCAVAQDAIRSGTLPLRVTHNDTKLNNVMLDSESGAGICIIDLDTVMPGLYIYDFGDAIRFGANDCEEDERDLDKVNFDPALFSVYTEAFLEGAGDALTQAERDYLSWGAKLMTLECGIRFLTDYLQGDTYFHTQRHGQNLDRARTQLKLVADMEAVWDELEAMC